MSVKKPVSKAKVKCTPTRVSAKPGPKGVKVKGHVRSKPQSLKKCK